MDKVAEAVARLENAEAAVEAAWKAMRAKDEPSRAEVAAWAALEVEAAVAAEAVWDAQQ